MSCDDSFFEEDSNKLCPVQPHEWIGQTNTKLATSRLNQMKKQFQKAAWVAALGLGVGTAAQAQINNEDLVLGFTSPNAASIGGVKSDYVIDLGSLTTLLGSGAQQITLSGSEYSDSTFTAAVGGAVTGGSAYVGIVGATHGSSGDVILSGVAGSTPPTGTKNNYQSAANFPSGLSLGEVSQSGQSFFNNIAQNPTSAGAAPSSFAQFVQNPLQGITSAQGTGGSALNLEIYRGTFTSIPQTASAFSDEGFVSILFSSNGGISGVAWDEAATAAAVPEPGTYGLFAGAGLLVLVLRRQLTGRTA